MLELIPLHTHRLATCTASGIIIATDLRLVGKVASPGLRITPPSRCVEGLGRDRDPGPRHHRPRDHPARAGARID
jgi:hypothetical protein